MASIIALERYNMHSEIAKSQQTVNNTNDGEPQDKMKIKRRTPASLISLHGDTKEEKKEKRKKKRKKKKKNR